MITAYVLPIMGGGAGAGAIPMAQVYSDVTGKSQASYLSFALAILALGNIIAILMAVVLDLVGKAFPKLAGNDKLLRDESKIMKTEKEEKVEVTTDDIAAAIFLTDRGSIHSKLCLHDHFCSISKYFWIDPRTPSHGNGEMPAVLWNKVSMGTDGRYGNRSN